MKGLVVGDLVVGDLVVGDLVVEAHVCIILCQHYTLIGPSAKHTSRLNIQHQVPTMKKNKAKVHEKPPQRGN